MVNTYTREQKPLPEVERPDTEITLGVGNLLALFFGLVVLCGISLGIGYSLGRNSAKQAMAAAAESANAAAPVPPTSSAAKPGAAQLSAPKPSDCSTPNENCPQQQPAASPSSTSDLTFYQSVQQKETHPQLAPPEPAPAAKPSETPHATLGTGYMVQIAAVRNQDDAKLLSDALQKQHFPVVIAQPGDKLFHVQVGPYADIKEAETIRGKLVSAGYNAFVKR